MGKPPLGRNMGKPPLGRNMGNLAQGWNMGKPPLGRNMGNLAQGRNMGNLAQGRNMGKPPLGRNMGKPLLGRNMGKPPLGRNMGKPPLGMNMGKHRGSGRWATRVSQEMGNPQWIRKMGNPRWVRKMGNPRWVRKLTTRNGDGRWAGHFPGMRKMGQQEEIWKPLHLPRQVQAATVTPDASVYLFCSVVYASVLLAHASASTHPTRARQPPQIAMQTSFENKSGHLYGSVKAETKASAVFVI